MKKLILITSCWLLVTTYALAYDGIAVRSRLSEVADAGNLTYTAYYNGNDNVIQTEDSFNNIAGAGYYIVEAVQRAFCEVQTDQVAGLNASASYDLWVASADKAGHAVKSPLGNLNPSTTDIVSLNEASFLAVPAGVSIAVGQGRLNLSWNAVAGATSYVIYRRDSSSAVVIYQKIAEVSGQTNYADFSANNVALTYRYIIIAVDSVNSRRSGHSAEVAAAPQEVDGDQGMTLRSIALTSTASTLRAGQNLSITATGTFSNNTVTETSDLTNSAAWSVEPMTAQITSAGVLTSTVPGDYSVTASSASVTSAPLTISVTPAAMTQINVATDRSEVVVGGTANITAVGRDDFDNLVASNTLVWTAPAAAGAQVVSAGVTDPRDSITLNGTVNINVIAGTLTSVSISADRNEVEVGGTVNIIATGLDQLGNTVATASETWTAPTVPGMQTRSLTVTDSRDRAALTDSVNINVIAGRLNSIAVIAEPMEVEAGGTVNINAIGRDSLGNEVARAAQSLTASTAAGNQVIPITVTDPRYAGSSLTENATILVKAGALSAIIVSPESIALEKGETATFNVKYQDRFGNEKYPALNSIYTADTVGAHEVDFSRDGIAKIAAVRVQPKISDFRILEDGAAIDANTNINIQVLDDAGNVVDAQSNGITISYTGADGGVFSVANKEDGAYDVSVNVNVGTRVISKQARINVNKNKPAVKIMNGSEELAQGTIVSSKPEFNVQVRDGNGIDQSSIRIYIDNAEVTNSDVRVSAVAADSIVAYSVEYKSSQVLKEGTHTLKVIARDSLGKESAVTVTGLRVFAEAAVTGTPMNYPNPARFGHGESTTIKYTLTADAEIKLMIFDITGRQVYSNIYSSGAEGGKAGANRVPFTGLSSANELLGNGVYHYLLVSDGKAIGRGQIAVLD